MVSLNINQLKPYENNPRFNDKAVDAVATSIKEFGFKVPIIVDKNNVIVAGHTRLKAAQKLGMTEVPVIIADDLTEEQVKAFRIADNKVAELAEWDFEKLEMELKELNLDMNQFGFEIEPETSEDNFDVDKVVEESTKNPVCQMGEIWHLGNHRLMVGDSTSKEDVSKLMNGEKADCVITDPPYNVAVKNSQGMTIQNDDMSNEDFGNFLTKAFACLNESLKEGGAFYVWYAGMEHINFEQSLNRTGLQVREQLIWVKSGFAFGRQDYHWRHEPCLYGWKDGAAHYFVDDRTQDTVIEDMPNLNKMSKEELKQYIKELREHFDNVPTTIIREDKPSHDSNHPTMKPIKLIAKLMKNSSKAGEKVLDLFGGSGTTLITAEQLNRKCFMMEYDPVYADVIIKRWEQLTGKKAILN